MEYKSNKRAAALLLAGCSAVGSPFSKNEVVSPPAKLVDFEEQIEVDEIWSRKVG
jgi:hypothetical protein